MIIDITSLKKNGVYEVPINLNYSFSKEELENSSILELNDVNINGSISLSDDIYLIDIEISGMMVLKDTITLEPINHNFLCQIEGNVVELLEEINESSKKTDLSIDIFPIIWENILMEIPMSITNNSDIVMEGDGWRLVNKTSDIATNPELEKLKNLLK